MWIVKGVLFGAVLFVVVFLGRFHGLFYGKIIGSEVLAKITYQSGLFWTALVGCVLLGCAIAGWWWWHPVVVASGQVVKGN